MTGSERRRSPSSPRPRRSWRRWRIPPMTISTAEPSPASSAPRRPISARWRESSISSSGTACPSCTSARRAWRRFGGTCFGSRRKPPAIERSGAGADVVRNRPHPFRRPLDQGKSRCARSLRRFRRFHRPRATHAATSRLASIPAAIHFRPSARRPSTKRIEMAAAAANKNHSMALDRTSGLHCQGRLAGKGFRIRARGLARRVRRRNGLVVTVAGTCPE